MANPVVDSTFETLVSKATGVVFVDFWAPWCGPCRAISPIVDELAEEYAGKIEIYKMNVDENSITPGKYAIRAIPTIMIFKDGELKEQITGGVAKEQLQEAIDKVLA